VGSFAEKELGGVEQPGIAAMPLGIQARKTAEIIAIKCHHVLAAHSGDEIRGAISVVAKMRVNDRRLDSAQEPPEPGKLSRVPAQPRQGGSPKSAKKGFLRERVQVRPGEPVEILGFETSDVLLEFTSTETDLVVNPVFGLSQPSGTAM